jgi:hypothetical protein
VESLCRLIGNEVLLSSRVDAVVDCAGASLDKLSRLAREKRLMGRVVRPLSSLFIDRLAEIAVDTKELITDYVNDAAEIWRTYAGSSCALEHFPIKWTPLDRQKMRPNKDLERRSDAIGSAL